VKDSAQAVTQSYGRNFAVLVFVEGIKHGITTQPLFAGDEPIPVEIVTLENLLADDTNFCHSLQLRQPLGYELF
jgi:hypothetical protein